VRRKSHDAVTLRLQKGIIGHEESGRFLSNEGYKGRLDVLFAGRVVGRRTSKCSSCRQKQTSDLRVK
jgi:hypothetical protein